MSNNIIIANAGAVVNVINNENALIKQSSRDKWQEKKIHAFIVAAKLQSAKKFKRADRMRMYRGARVSNMRSYSYKSG